MTKKFWNDWQKRIGETKAIYGWVKYTGFDGIERKREGGNLIGYLPFKILSAKFNGDTVDLIIEETSLNVITDRYHVKNRYVTLNRKEISTVKFIKY